MTKTFFHRALALALALIMLISLSSAAFAAEDEEETPGTSASEGGNAENTGAESGGEETDPEESPAPSVTVSLQKNISLTMGSAVSLEGQVTYDLKNITDNDVTYHWSFTDSSARDYVDLSSVNSKFPTLTPLSVTRTVLRLRVDAQYTANGESKTATAQCEVEVGYALPDSISLSNRILERDKGADPVVLTAVQLAQTVDGMAAGLCDDSKLSWRSSDTDVADVVEKTGGTTHISFKKPGTATITVTAKGTGGKDVTATCSVTVAGILVKYDGEDITDKEITIPVGREIDLAALVIGDKFTGTYAFWETGSQAVYVNSTTGRVTAQAAGRAQITVTQAGDQAHCTINVVENTVGSISAGGISSDQTLQLYSLLADLNSAYRQAMQDADIVPSPAGLSHLTNLSVSTAEGVLYYNYVSPVDHGYGVGGTEQYYVNPSVGRRGLEGVTFVPNSGFTGTAVIRYSGYDDSYRSFSGTIRVPVSVGEDVVYTTGQNIPIAFACDDFNSIHRDLTGRDIRYVSFDLPSAEQGTLYYDYIGTGTYASRVTESERYYRTGFPVVDRITFVPAENFSGSVRITYYVTDTAGAVRSGYVTVRVNGTGENRNTGVNYTAQQGEEVAFRAADFSAVCREALDGQSLDYLYFTTLPDSSVGTLWYRYNSNSTRSRVTAASRYYQTNSSTRPGVGGVYFIPASTTVGAVTIPFTAYSTGGNRFSGTVTIRYSAVGEGELEFHIYANEAARFNAADFNEVCLDATGSSFDYIRFDELPNASTQGSLYSGYYSASSIGSRITGLTGTYSRTSSLDRVAFVPVTGFSGTVTIPFTAYKTGGSRVFTGTINIQVEGIGDFTVRYNAYSGRETEFEAADFNAACLAVTGNSLNYVQFQLPDSRRGTLYYNYDTSKSNNTKVSTGTSYYRASTYSRKVSEVSFIPAPGFTGTVSFTYTGVSSNYVRYSGVVEITVSAAAAQDVTLTGGSLPLAINASSLYQACSQVLPGGLSYMEFITLPASRQGAMYWGYNPPSSGTRVTTGTRYYYSGAPGINWLTFVPKAEYTGQVVLTYRAYDANGASVTGTLTLIIASEITECHFRDMAAYRWAAPSAEFLYQSGVVRGTNTAQTEYTPSGRIKRCEFTVMLCRAFGLETASTTSFPDVPADSFYAKDTATAKALGIVTAAEDGLFHPQEDLSRQEAMLMLYRAMGVSGRSLPSSGADLSGYPDNGQILAQARTAVAVMVHLGVLRGTDAGLLAPTGTFSRAEMAVVLHRALTL